MVINLYIGKDFVEFFDQLKVIAEANDKSFAGMIGKAVKEYILKANDEVQLLADKDEWKKFINKASKQELLEISTLICDINNKIIRKCQK